MLRTRLNPLGQRLEYELPGKAECGSRERRQESSVRECQGRSHAVLDGGRAAPLRSWTASDKPKAVQPGERPGSLSGRQLPHTTVAIEQKAIQERRKQRDRGRGYRPDTRALYGLSGVLKLKGSPEGPRIQAFAYRRRVFSTKSCYRDLLL